MNSTHPNAHRDARTVPLRLRRVSIAIEYSIHLVSLLFLSICSWQATTDLAVTNDMW